MSLKLERLLSTSLVVAALVWVAGCQSDEPTKEVASANDISGKLASDWISLQLRFSKESPGFTPPVVSRAFGYAGLAMYESVVHGIPNGKSLVGQLTNLNSLPLPDKGVEYHWGLCANAASAQITRTIFENAPVPLLPLLDSLEQVYIKEFGSSVSLEVAARSIAYGRLIADSVYYYSTTDGGHKGFNRNFPASYVPPVGPGLWQPTNSQLAMLPTWGNNRTFIKNLSTIIADGGFPTYSTDPASAFYAEANEVYTTSVNMTQEQRDIAFYWADEGFVTFTPPGHSICIYSQLGREEGFSLSQMATGYAKLGMAVSDAFVYCWKIKYTYNLLRPSQYIRANIDPTWTPLIINPPFPDYPSGHATQSGSVAKVLTGIFGENYAFTDLTHTKLALGILPRSFTSFYQMAEETGYSRILGGIHFHSADYQGRLSGEMIGDLILSLSFTQ